MMGMERFQVEPKKKYIYKRKACQLSFMIFFSPFSKFCGFFFIIDSIEIIRSERTLREQDVVHSSLQWTFERHHTMAMEWVGYDDLHEQQHAQGRFPFQQGDVLSI